METQDWQESRAKLDSTAKQESWAQHKQVRRERQEPHKPGLRD